MSAVTSELKAISDYTGLGFRQIEALPYPQYLLYRRDAWIYTLKQSENGRDFLKTLWRLGQTAADQASINKFRTERRTTNDI